MATSRSTPGSPTCTSCLMLGGRKICKACVKAGRKTRLLKDAGAVFPNMAGRWYWCPVCDGDPPEQRVKE